MEELLTISEVAKRLRVDQSSVRRWIKLGAMEAVVLPHKGKRQIHRVKRETLDRVLASTAA